MGRMAGPDALGSEGREGCVESGLLVHTYRTRPATFPAESGEMHV